MSEKIRVITEDQYKEYMELKKQFADTTKKVRWKPKVGDVYYYITTTGDIEYFKWVGTSGYSIDDRLYKINNCFQTIEEAQKELARRVATQELLDMCDWDGGEKVYLIEYNDQRDVFDWNWFDYIYSPYRFASEESAQKAIDTLGTEKLKLIFRID